jgi:hypothetical protein
VYAVETTDEAVELLTGIPAGRPDAEGRFPEGTINHRAAGRLEELFRLRQEISREAAEKNKNE